MIVREIISAALLLIGFALMVVSAIGVVRLPDFFSRLHASSIGETLGIVLTGIGLAIYHGVSLTSLKILMVVGALFLVNPLGTHLISKAAIRSGQQPWKEENHADISD